MPRGIITGVHHGATKCDMEIIAYAPAPHFHHSDYTCHGGCPRVQGPWQTIESTSPSSILVNSVDLIPDSPNQ